MIGLKHKSDQDRLQHLVLFSLSYTTVRGDLVRSYNIIDTPIHQDFTTTLLDEALGKSHAKMLTSRYSH